MFLLMLVCGVCFPAPFSLLEHRTRVSLKLQYVLYNTILAHPGQLRGGNDSLREVDLVATFLFLTIICMTTIAPQALPVHLLPIFVVEKSTRVS